MRQQLRVLRTELPGDKRGTSTSVVLASEIDAPAGVKPVQWRLLTNRLVETPGTGGRAIGLVPCALGKSSCCSTRQERLPHRAAAA